MTVRDIAWYLRDGNNVHYLATLRPYLDEMSGLNGFRHHLVVAPTSAPGDTPDFADVSDLLTESASLDDFDLVVTPSWLRAEERPSATPMVQTFHGLSDKPFTTERPFADYAALLCVGQRQIDRLRTNPANRTAACRAIGWPKFDGVVADRRVPGARPRVVYAPTWRKGGFSSIERFLAGGVVETLSARFDVVVKPHPNLLNPSRPFFDPRIATRIRATADLPGVRLVTDGNILPELAAADVCITDASSVGHEWLYFARPLVILNPQPGSLRPCEEVDAATYLWQAGEVCDDAEQLAAVVARAIEHDDRARTRERLLNYSVHRPRDGRAASRGAAVIADIARG